MSSPACFPRLSMTATVTATEPLWRGGGGLICRVGQLVVDLCWVDIYFGLSTTSPILLGQLDVWQNWLLSWADWWNFEIKVNPTQDYDHLPDPIILKDDSNYLFQIAELARHPEGSQGYNLAVIKLLLHLKESGININEMSADGVSDPTPTVCLKCISTGWHIRLFSRFGWDQSKSCIFA